MQDFTDIAGDKDLTNKRFLTLDNGNKLYVERTDPYGFWKVHYDKGQVPERLTGNYTSFDRAMADVNSYLNSLPVPVQAKAEIGETKENTKLKAKQVNAA